MKAWFKKKFLEWSKEAWESERQAQGIMKSSEVLQTDPSEPPKMRFAIQQAINGKFIEVVSYKTNQQRGHNCVTEYYLVPEGKKVSEALTMLMLLKGADE